MIVCQECGNSAPSGDGFCSSCGVLLEWSGEAVEPIPVAALISPPVAIRPESEAIRPAPIPITRETQYDGLFCSACGTRNIDGRSYCRYCGTALDLSVAVATRRRWWQRIFHRAAKAGPSAGERPKRFRRQEISPNGMVTGKKSRRFSLRSHLPLSRVAPLLIVLGLLGVGVGPARLYLTKQANVLFGQAKDRVSTKLVPVTPVTASASSIAVGHGAQSGIDGVQSTFWQSGDPRNAIGQSLTITFANAVDIDTIAILSGLPGPDFRTQARVNTVALTVNGKAVKQVTFSDSADFQNTSVTLKSVTTLTMVVVSTFPGQTGNAVAIREVEFSQRQSSTS